MTILLGWRYVAYCFFFIWCTWCPFFVSPLHPSVDLCDESFDNVCGKKMKNPLTAVVISIDDERFKSAQDVLEKDVGFGIINRHHPLSWNDPGLLSKFADLTGVNASFLTQHMRKYVSLTVAFIDIIKSFALSNGDMRNWLYIFEDDIALHNASVSPLCDIRGGEKVAMGDGIMYLGACPKTCYKYSAVSYHERRYEKCWGHCAHAIGITKWKSWSLPDMLKIITYNSPLCEAKGAKIHDRCYFFDTALRDYGQATGGIYLVSPHLSREQTGGYGAFMRGIIYQNREKFHSSIITGN